MRRLTDIRYWEENWWKRDRPRRLSLYRDFDFETLRLLRSVTPLPGDAGGAARPRVLEIGAGGSTVLPYLGRRFSYQVFGSDFSLTGCLLLRANLALQGVEGHVVCEDLFRSSLPAGAFDLVYSSGLIEHFDDTRAVVAEHLRLVKPGGRLVFIVPNLQGIQGKIVRRFAPPLWNVHRVFGPDDLAGFLKGLGLERLQSGYLGSFLIRIMRGCEWSVVSRWPEGMQRFVHGSTRLVNGLISLLFRLSPLRPHSKAFSPAFFAVGTRPRA